MRRSRVRGIWRQLQPALWQFELLATAPGGWRAMGLQLIERRYGERLVPQESSGHANFVAQLHARNSESAGVRASTRSTLPPVTTANFLELPVAGLVGSNR